MSGSAVRNAFGIACVLFCATSVWAAPGQRGSTSRGAATNTPPALITIRLEGTGTSSTKGIPARVTVIGPDRKPVRVTRKDDATGTHYEMPRRAGEYVIDVVADGYKPRHEVEQFPIRGDRPSWTKTFLLDKLPVVATGPPPAAPTDPAPGGGASSPDLAETGGRGGGNDNSAKDFNDSTAGALKDPKNGTGGQTTVASTAAIGGDKANNGGKAQTADSASGGTSAPSRPPNSLEHPGPGRPNSFAWVLPLPLLLVALTFQLLAFRRARATASATLRLQMGDIQNAVRDLESSVKTVVSQRESDRAAATDPAAATDQPAQFVRELERGAVQDADGRDQMAAIVRDFNAGLQAVANPVVETEPVRPVTVLGEYDQTRSAPDSTRAIERFERLFPGTRLSLINGDELRTNPRAIPQFQQHGRGYFLAVAQDGQWQCFPWFTFELSDEAYKWVFDYRGAAGLHVTRPATLDRQGEMWTLARRGAVENTL